MESVDSFMVVIFYFFLLSEYFFLFIFAMFCHSDSTKRNVLTAQRNKKKSDMSTESQKTMSKRQKELPSGMIDAVLAKLEETGKETFARSTVSKVINRKLPATMRNLVILEAYKEVCSEFQNRVESVLN